MIIIPSNFNRRNPIHLAAFGFGSGLAAKAPGTFGTIAALPFLFLIEPLGSIETALVLSLAFVVGCYLCGKTAKDLGVHDHGGIVWDEFVGMWITLFMIPLSGMSILLGFILFRLFDIWKPWPIRLADKHVHGGFGIMIDDVFAGVYAWAVMAFIASFYPRFLTIF